MADGERVQSVGFDAVEEVIVSWVEQFGDGRDVIATIAKTLPATQQQVKAHSVGSQSHPGPSWRRILDVRDDYCSKYVIPVVSRASAVFVSHTVICYMMTGAYSRGHFHMVKRS